MNVLHIASFNGNIGDIINHSGFEAEFKKKVINNVEFVREEIRDYYKVRNFKSFNTEKFIKLANSFDLIVIGGGNFLSPWLEISNNGTTFDISVENFKKITTPILFNAVGCEGSLGYSEKTLHKIRKFFDHILLSEASDKYFFTVRNDGSYSFIKDVIGKSYSSKVFEVPDNGFFCPIENLHPSSNREKTLGLSISEDRLKAKLSPNEYKAFIQKLASIISLYVKESYHIKFIPHTFNDYKVLVDLFDCLKDDVVRNHMVVSQLQANSKSGREVMGSYVNCDQALVMRFHASIACIKLNIPFVTLTLDQRLLSLFDNLELENIVNINKSCSVRDIKKLFINSSHNYDDVLNQLDTSQSIVFNRIKRWVNTNKLLE
ncbi:polysaccharide pyruvyl transferase family protein [Halobacillus sp. A1]|uniref:polysaccharide pyruvyl transferase family protein n=1 Tax=Halobacillus sp. A1 TaxID=2880262 RepID=UPI0020A6412F|nr:polysaccharide pyruvyl transferase family protein [Halobacillus sp. A1]